MVSGAPRIQETDGDADTDGGATEMLKVLIAGLLALSISTLAASVLLQFNTGRFLPTLFLVVSCVLTVFICCFTWAALLHAFGCAPHGAVVFLGLTLPLGSWFLIHANHEYWLLGPGVAGVTAAEAGRHRYASSLRLTDARVATEHHGTKSVRYGGGRGHQPRTKWYYVAPIVHEDWRPGQPVSLWAAAPPNQYYGSLEDWSKPYRAGVQLSSYELRHLREAAADSEEWYGARLPDDAIFIRWTPEPEAEVDRARKFVLWVIAGNDLLLVLLFVGASIAARLRMRHRKGSTRAEAVR